MKTLIVEDNPSVVAILTEILTVDGHEVFTASNWDEAKRELDLRKPDILFLDTIVDQKSMIPFVDELDESIDTKVVLILNGREQIPKDTSLIVRSIKKPFNSSEVLDAVNYVGNGCTVVSKTLDKKPKWFKFLMKSKDGEGYVEKHISDDPVMRGKSYIIYEKTPDRIYELVDLYRNSPSDILIITTTRKQTIENKFSFLESNDKDGKPSVITLSRSSKEDYVDIKALGTLMARIMEHIEGVFWPVIIIDDLTQIIHENDLNSVLTFIYQIYSGAKELSKRPVPEPEIGSDDVPSKEGRFFRSGERSKGKTIVKQISMAVSVDDALLTEKDKNLFERYMENYGNKKTSKGE